MGLVYESQTDLVKRLGVTRNAVGKWLRDLGLRSGDGAPTPAGWTFAKAVPVDPNGDLGRVFYVWAVYQVLPLLTAHQQSLAGNGGAA